MRVFLKLVLVLLFSGVALASPAVEAHHKFDHDKGRVPILTVESGVAGQPFDINGSNFKKRSTVYVGLKFFCCLTPVTVSGLGTFVHNHPGIPSGTYIAVAGFFKAGRFNVIESDPFVVP